jgi:hypothetical protein
MFHCGGALASADEASDCALRSGESRKIKKTQVIAS